MTRDELVGKLEELRVLATETEWVESKRNVTNTDLHEDIGQYLSAIANSLPLVQKPRGYVVWGIDDTSHSLVGTDFKPRKYKIGNEELESWLTRHLRPQVRFVIHELEDGGKRFVLFKVSPATHSPVEFQHERYVRVGSLKKALRDCPEKEHELFALLRRAQDWSAQVIDGTSVADLDPLAVAFARTQFAGKHDHLAAESAGWDDRKFLEKAKVVIDGRLTRAAVILLGTPESERHLSPAVARLTRVLKGLDNADIDYRHFHSPLLPAVDRVFALIRNPTYRYLPNATLFPVELPTYEPWVIRETLHNAIAHQDYTLGARVSVVETADHLLFSNAGSFAAGSVEEVIRRDAPPDRYRNRLLTDAMVAFKLIDTVGSGIRRMFHKQRERNFPMPDYDLTAPDRVLVRIPGTVIDEKYTRMLAARRDLALFDVIALDKVQKKRPLADAEFDSLKKKKLIEGRRPNLYVSATVAAATDTQADYIKKKSFDKAHFEKMVLAYLDKFGTAIRADLDKLLLDKVSDALDAKKKSTFVSNLLRGLRAANRIRVVGRGPGAKWELCKSTAERDG